MLPALPSLRQPEDQPVETGRADDVLSVEAHTPAPARAVDRPTCRRNLCCLGVGILDGRVLPAHRPMLVENAVPPHLLGLCFLCICNELRGMRIPGPPMRQQLAWFDPARRTPGHYGGALPPAWRLANPTSKSFPIDLVRRLSDESRKGFGARFQVQSQSQLIWIDNLTAFNDRPLIPPLFAEAVGATSWAPGQAARTLAAMDKTTTRRVYAGALCGPSDCPVRADDPDPRIGDTKTPGGRRFRHTPMWKWRDPQTRVGSLRVNRVTVAIRKKKKQRNAERGQAVASPQ